MKKESSNFIKSKAQTLDVSAKDYCAKISHFFISNFQPLIENNFNAIEKKLFTLADNARSNNKQNLYLSTINLIKNNKEELQQSYCNSLKKIFSSFATKDLSYSEPVAIKSKNSFSLELIDDNELNETLTISNLIRKSNTAYQKQLYALKLRFSKIVSISQITTEQLPLSPYVIVNTFANCLKLINLTSGVKLEIYKVFERMVMANLNTSYSPINQYFKDNNIVPNIDYSIQKKSNSKKEKKTNATPQDRQHKQTHIANDEYLTRSNNLSQQTHFKNEQSLDYNYQSILQTLKNSRATTNPTQYNANHHFETEKNLKGDFQNFTSYLTRAQKQLTQKKLLSEKLSRSPIEISQTVLTYFNNENHPRYLSQKDEDVIDLIGLLFQYIIDSENLPNKIQVILSKLQIPFLKVALKDGNLFANKNHEARVLLNSLAKASLGWNEEADTDGKFIAKISEITQHILDIEYLSPKVFQLLQMNFDNFLKKTNKKFKITQERTKKTTLAHEKIVRAKEASAKLLMRKIKSNKVLPSIRDLLIVDWFNVLNLMYLRYSEDSNEINEKIDFVDKVINYTKVYNGTKKELDAILHNYEEGLKMVAYNPREMKKKIGFLEELLYQFCQESIPNKANKQDSSNIFSLDEVRNKQRELLNILDDCVAKIDNDVIYSQVEDNFYQMAKDLKIGTWLNFKNIAEKSIRAKLSWVSPLSHKYLFVNSKGVKITHKSRLELAHGFRCNKIQKIDSGIIFDLALYTISKKLKNNKKAVNLKNLNLH